MSRRHHIDAFADTDDETFGLLESRFAKVTTSAQQALIRRGQKGSNDSDHETKARKVPRTKHREWSQIEHTRPEADN